MTDEYMKADFKRAQKASSFFEGASVLFDRLDELGIIPEQSDREKFQMILSDQERRKLKKVLNMVWDIYTVKRRRLNRNIKKKKKKLKRKKEKKERMEDKIREYEQKIAEADNEAERKSATSSLEMYEDRRDETEDMIITIEQQLEELKDKQNEKGEYDPSLLKYDPEFSPLYNELQNTVYDGVSRARQRYGEYATIPASTIKDQPDNGSDEKGEDNGRR